MEAYGPYDMDWVNTGLSTLPPNIPIVSETFGSTGFAKLPYYLDHNNTRPNDDFSCWATGSQYAELKWTDFPFSTTVNFCSIPECWKKFTFADVAYDVDHGREFMGECTDESSNRFPIPGIPWNGKTYVPCETNLFPSPIPECSLCCAMNTHLGFRNYPCYAHNPFYQSSTPRFPQLQTIFGASSACSPTDLTRDTFPARYAQFNGLNWDRISPAFGPAQNLMGTYTEYQPIIGGNPSYSVFGTLKDCAAGPVPQGYRWDGFRALSVFVPSNVQPYKQIQDSRDGSDAYFSAPISEGRSS